MIKQILALCLSSVLTFTGFAQKLADKDIPTPVKAALEKSYTSAANVTWEKEKGNYEANWGGKSGEDNSVLFTPSGDFIEIVTAMPINQLPSSITLYVKEHYNAAKITEAGKVTDAKGKLSYEIEVNRKDLIFDEKGGFVKAED
jgi:Putative beta-lactamase-inhibitor-like, PepSY-like